MGTLAETECSRLIQAERLAVAFLAPIRPDDDQRDPALRFLVSKWCPSEAKVGEIWGTSVTLWNSHIHSDIKQI